MKKQITIVLPAEVVATAERLAVETKRPDGLKQTVTRVLRDWILVGMTAGRSEERGRANGKR